MESGGYYCSTSRQAFADKEALAEHYKSDLHRYNLKRKVAGLPPVTKEWYDARKAQLESMANRADDSQLLICPLTNKKFQSRATYENHTQTKKFRDAMKKAGLTEAPEPKVVSKQQQAQPSGAAAKGDVSRAMRGMAVSSWQRPGAAQKKQGGAESGDSSGDSDWETDDEYDGDTAGVSANAEWSEEDEAPDAVPMSSSDSAANGAAVPPNAEDWEQWDLRRSLFDNHMSPTFEKNLEYMWKHFSFYFPDAAYLKDPEGLLRYLGAKLQYGRVPLSTRGDDEAAKQFASLHAVQRHMVDTNRCKMCYDGNEEEYEDFYEYPDIPEELIALDEADDIGSELKLRQPGTNAVRILGSREFRQLYKQRHKPVNERTAAASKLLLTYGDMGVPEAEVEKRAARLKHDKHRQWHNLKYQMANDKIQNLPKNVPY